MRKIKYKFRAFIKPTESSEGFMIYPNDESGYKFIYNGEGFNIVDPKGVELPEDSFIIMMSTGTFDKNKIEVYAGDIAGNFPKENGFSEKPVAVKFNEISFDVYNPECCETCKEGTGCICTFDEFWFYVGDGDFKVLGNIYQNYDLIEKRKVKK